MRWGSISCLDVDFEIGSNIYTATYIFSQLLPVPHKGLMRHYLFFGAMGKRTDDRGRMTDD